MKWDIAHRLPTGCKAHDKDLWQVPNSLNICKLSIYKRNASYFIASLSYRHLSFLLRTETELSI